MPDSTVEEPTTPDAPATPKKSRATGIVVIILLVGVVCAVAYYYPSLTGWLALKGWAKNGPIECLTQFSAAVDAGDAAAIEKLCPGAEVQVDESSGQLLTVKAPNPMGMGKHQPMEPDIVAPAVPIEGATLRWSYEKRRVQCYVDTKAGGRMRYEARCKSGNWYIFWFTPAGVDENWD